MVVFKVAIEGRNAIWDITVEDDKNVVTIHHIKQRIEQVIGVEVARQSLKYNGKVLEDAQNIEYYNLEDGSLLKVSEEFSNKHLISIRLYGEGKSRNEIMSEVNSLRELKDIVAKCWDVNYDSVHLFYNEEEMVDDDALLSEYRMTNMVDVRVEINV